VKKNIAILGSTGSIGKQALEIISNYKELFEIEVLTANSNADLLIEQALKYNPNSVVIADDSKYNYVSETLKNTNIKVFAGNKSIEQIVELDNINIVLNSLVGFAGFIPTINAIKTNKTIALANKETLVVGGEIIMNLAQDHKVKILPVDSEHSAIFQCLIGEGQNKIDKLFLTASGGPFRNYSLEELEKVTFKDALKHPIWQMGNKITIDSATLMNKGLEVIEAKWLFDVNPCDIEVVVHPQSIIHSMVQFSDGSVKAQMGLPNMQLPIIYALSFPERLETNLPKMDFSKFCTFTFEKPDTTKFKNLALAYYSIEKGGNMPCILNASNEIVVDAFLKEKISFLKMSEIIEECLNKINFIKNPNIEDLYQTDLETRKYTSNLINKIS